MATIPAPRAPLLTKEYDARSMTRGRASTCVLAGVLVTAAACGGGSAPVVVALPAPVVPAPSVAKPPRPPPPEPEPEAELPVESVTSHPAFTGRFERIPLPPGTPAIVAIEGRDDRDDVDAGPGGRRAPLGRVPCDREGEADVLHRQLLREAVRLRARSRQVHRRGDQELLDGPERLRVGGRVRRSAGHARGGRRPRPGVHRRPAPLADRVAPPRRPIHL